MLFSAAIARGVFSTALHVFPLASLLFSSDSSKSAGRLEEESHLRVPATASLLLIEFYNLRPQCPTELSVVTADNQI